jgi:hypothetical protein
MRGDYLFYEEKIETTQEEREAKAARRFVTNIMGLTRGSRAIGYPGLEEHLTPTLSSHRL